MTAVPIHLTVVHDLFLVVTVVNMVASVRVEVDFMKAAVPNNDGHLPGLGVDLVDDRSAHIAMEGLVITPSDQKFLADTAGFWL